MANEVLPGWLREAGADAMVMAACILLVLAYYAFHRKRVRRDPTYSIHYVNDMTRRIWVESVMSGTGKDIMAVQTLRNFIMYPILMVSTCALLIVGTLTLSGQAGNIANSWHAINLGGSHSAGVWIVKIMFLLVDFLVAFFAYVSAIRLANHVLFMINIPREAQSGHDVLSPSHVADRLILAGKMVAVGMRTLIFAIPLAFWLFGPLYLLIGTVGVVGFLSRLDRHQRGL